MIGSNLVSTQSECGLVIGKYNKKTSDYLPQSYGIAYPKGARVTSRQSNFS